MCSHLHNPAALTPTYSIQGWVGLRVELNAVTERRNSSVACQELNPTSHFIQSSHYTYWFMLAATWLYSLEVLGRTMVYANLNVSVKLDIPDMWLCLVVGRAAYRTVWLYCALCVYLLKYCALCVCLLNYCALRVYICWTIVRYVFICWTQQDTQ